MVLPYVNMNPPQVYTCSPSWTPLSPLSPYHLSGSSQCTSPKNPVSCIEPGLAIRFICDIIHVSMSFSQVIPPLPSPTECKRLFYTSVSLLLSCIQGYHYHLYDLYHCQKKFLVQQPIYTHRKIIKTHLLHQSLDPHVFLSLFLSFSFLLSTPNRQILVH